MSRYPAYLRRQHHATDQANIERATKETHTTEDLPQGSAGKLRGIPAIAQGVPGAINGTAPHHSIR